MLQYFINTSIIWLACLLLYEFFLSKESFHQYNRAYLLLSVIAGLLLPLTKLKTLMPAAQNSILLPVRQVYETKKSIQLPQVNEIVEPIVSSGNYIEPALWIVYLIGILIGLILLTREVLLLFRLYKHGTKSAEHGCVVVETGKDHCAFSFFKIVFIRNRQDYNTAQWTLLMSHEKEHGRQLHFLDNLLLIILRIVCWFNPLPHIFYRRLRIVHEFQADQAAAANTFDYGTFLLEQNLMQGAPILTHSINYSPIKTRIVMLTRTKSNSYKLLKYLTVLPLLFILIICCTQSSFSGEVIKKGKKVHFKGNEIEFGELKFIPFEYRETMEQQKKVFLYTTVPDSVPVKNWATGQIIRMDPIMPDVMPVAINGKHIFGNEPQYMLSDAEMNYVEPVFSGTVKNLDEYLFSNLKKELDKLEDGNYIFRIDRLVIDDKGSIAYYENNGIDFSWPNEKKQVIADDIRDGIERKLDDALAGSVRFKPALKDGKLVNVRLSLDKYQIVVKDHKAQLVERGGC